MPRRHQQIVVQPESDYHSNDYRGEEDERNEGKCAWPYAFELLSLEAHIASLQ